ncbi:MAG: AAA family ATPase, partial [Verrucomicrobiia bacterium]
MILLRLDIANWRSLTGTISVGPFSEQITILHAPNGTGKSALFEAVRFAFFDAHTVTGDEANAIRPWGRALSPEVAAEFQTTGGRYRITKRFLASKKSLLERWEGDRFQPLAEGRAADAEVRSLLGAPLSPGRGCSRPEHWGLQQVLWTPQEGLRLPDVPDVIGARLKAALGVAPMHEGAGKTASAVAELFHRYFTPTGTLRKNASLTALEARTRSLENSLGEARERLGAYEDAIRQVEDARLARAQLTAEAAPIELQLARVQENLSKYNQLKSAYETTALTVHSLAERLAKLRSELERIAADRELITAGNQQLAALKAEEARLETERTATANLIAEASLERAALAAVAEAAAVAGQTFLHAKEWHAATLEERNLATRLSRCQELDAFLRTAR